MCCDNTRTRQMMKNGNHSSPFYCKSVCCCYKLSADDDISLIWLSLKYSIWNTFESIRSASYHEIESTSHRSSHTYKTLKICHRKTQQCRLRGNCEYNRHKHYKLKNSASKNKNKFVLFINKNLEFFPPSSEIVLYVNAKCDRMLCETDTYDELNVTIHHWYISVCE